MVHLTSIICVKSKGKVRLDHRTNVDAGAHVPCHNRLGIVNHPSTGRGDRESRIPCGLSGTPPSETCTSRQLTTPHGTLFTVHRLFYCDLVTEIGRHDTRKVTGTRSDDRYNVELPTRRRKMKEGGREEEPTDAPEAAAPGMRIEHTCCCLGVLVGISLIAALVAVILMKDTTVEVTVLRQVHVLMSHGERTPSERELAMLGAPPPDHVFSPYGAGAMTNEGKMLTYEMGALLRKRYNEFLGPYYDEENSIVIASDTELSKMTALLISAGLWPPPEEQMWNETILWQPVSYTYPPRNQDYLLYEENCPRYLQEKQRILDAFTEEGLLSPYKDFFHKIAQMTNTNFSTPQEAYDLNNLFLIQDDIKVANPKWAKHVKRKLMDIARLEYSMMFHNNLLRKLSGGALLQQIIKEATSNIAEGPNLRVIVRTATPENVAALLAACVAPPPRLPDPGAALLFELHERLPQPHQKNKKAVLEKARFGLKIYYWDDDSAEPRLMEVPGCDAPFCPIDTFKDLTKYTISHNHKEDCKIAPVT